MKQAEITLSSEVADQVLRALDLAQALLQSSRHHGEILGAYNALRATMTPPANLRELALTLRAERALQHHGIVSIAQLSRLSWRKLRRLEGIGTLICIEVNDALTARGLTLSAE